MKKIKAGWKHGWPWGLFMFLWMEVLPMLKEKKFDPILFVIGLIIWTTGGLCFGLWVNHSIEKKKQKKQATPEHGTHGEPPT